LSGKSEPAPSTCRVRGLGTHLPSTAGSPREARTFVAAALDSWGVSGDRAGDVVLAASELVTNAFEHGSGGIAVRLRLSGRCVLVEVRDSSPADPVLRPPAPDSVRGRGLPMIPALSSAWGHRRAGDGKWVWAEFELT
jgi:anti-sigma regulatory factor (Ser/Thr protein kinase)